MYGSFFAEQTMYGHERVSIRVIFGDFARLGGL